MNGRLFSMMMLFVALALALSLTVALAPDAGAQNSRPSAKDIETNTHAIPAIGDSKVCCICILPGSIPSPDTEASSSQTTETTGTKIYGGPSRWFCTKYCLIQ